MSTTLNLVLLLVGRELDDIEADLALCEHQWFIDKSLDSLRTSRTSSPTRLQSISRLTW